MKLVFSGDEYEDLGVGTVLQFRIKQEALEFAKLAGNRWQAALPVRFSTGDTVSNDSYVEATLPITIEANSQTAKGGNLRTVVKVSLPYQGLIPLSKQNAGEALRIDSSRSGREISMHIVINMPREAAQDLRNHAGTAGQVVASEHITLLSTLLNKLLGPIMADRSVSRAASSSIIGLESGGAEAGDTIEVAGGAEALPDGSVVWSGRKVDDADHAAIDGIQNVAPSCALVIQQASGGLAARSVIQVGHNSTGTGSMIPDVTRPDSVLMRAALGLIPLDESAAYAGIRRIALYTVPSEG